MELDLFEAKYSEWELEHDAFLIKKSKDYLNGIAVNSLYLQTEAGTWVVTLNLNGKWRYVHFLNEYDKNDIVTLDFSNRKFAPKSNKYRNTITLDGYTITIEDNYYYNICLFALVYADKLFLNGQCAIVHPINCNKYVSSRNEDQINTCISLKNISITHYDKYNEATYMMKADASIRVYDANLNTETTFEKYWTDPENCWIQMNLSDVRFISAQDMKIYDRQASCAECFLNNGFEPYLGCDEKKRTIYLLKSQDRIGGYSFEFDNYTQYYLLAEWFAAVLSSKDTIPEEANASPANPNEPTQSEAVSSAFDTLDHLIGLHDIKNDVKELIAFAKVQKDRRDRGLKAVPVSLHLVFTGNPGTGKTSVARILAELYKEIGILSSGQLVEVDRADLVAGYVGQTAIKTQEKIKEAMGGILFIDEAYTLAKDGNDFGQEAIDTILKAMEDNRDQFIVIVAGYSEPMSKFINSNPGLKSRFNKYISFPDYDAGELYEIFASMCNNFDYILEDNANEILKTFFAHLVENKDENFANARDVRNLFENIITNQALRIASTSGLGNEEMMTISLDDINNAISLR